MFHSTFKVGFPKFTTDCNTRNAPRPPKVGISGRIVGQQCVSSQPNMAPPSISGVKAVQHPPAPAHVVFTLLECIRFTYGSAVESIHTLVCKIKARRAPRVGRALGTSIGYYGAHIKSFCLRLLAPPLKMKHLRRGSRLILSFEL